ARRTGGYARAIGTRRGHSPCADAELSGSACSRQRTGGSAMRIGEIERVGEREIPMPNLTPQAPPEPAPPARSANVSHVNRRGCLKGIVAATGLSFPKSGS